MMKQFICAGLVFFMSVQVFAQTNSFDSRQQQVIDLIGREETVIREEKEKIESLSTSIARAQTVGSMHEILIPVGIGAGAGLGYIAARTLVSYANIREGVAITLWGVVAAVGTVVSVNSVVRLVLNREELARLRSNLEVAKKSLEIREVGVARLKERIGIDLKGYEFETNGKAISTPLLIPNNRTSSVDR
jgi:hypothetical protein